jgi:acetyl esterase
MASPSYRENGEDPFLSRAEMVWYWDQYLASGGDRKDPYAAPLHAENLEGLPPTHIVTAGFDVLRDEGEALAARLREAGVPVTLRRYDDMVHGFLIMGRYLDTARQGIEDVGRLLRQALATPVRA